MGRDPGTGKLSTPLCHLPAQLETQAFVEGTWGSGAGSAGVVAAVVACPSWATMGWAYR